MENLHAHPFLFFNEYGKFTWSSFFWHFGGDVLAGFRFCRFKCRKMGNRWRGRDWKEKPRRNGGFCCDSVSDIELQGRTRSGWISVLLWGFRSIDLFQRVFCFRFDFFFKRTVLDSLIANGFGRELIWFIVIFTSVDCCIWFWWFFFTRNQVFQISNDLFVVFN